MTASAAAVMAEQCTGRGRDGVVCAAAPLAALAGATCLREGGNAFDAAVAAALSETVLLPPKCGLGGDLVAIVLRSGADRPEALIAVGGAPSGLAAVAAAGAWRDVGPHSVGPPAAAAGYDALADLGVLGRERLAAPARDLASNGFPWAEVCTRLSEQAAALVAEMNPDGCAYYPDAISIAPGALTKLPGLADALAEWVRLGDRMLDGPVGDAIVEAVQSRGGVLDRPSLEYARAPSGHRAPLERSPADSCGQRPRRRTVHRCSTRSTPPQPTRAPSIATCSPPSVARATCSPTRAGRRSSVPATGSATWS